MFVQGRSQTSCEHDVGSGMSVLEKSAVTNRVLKRYGDYVEDLRIFAGKPLLEQRSADQVDAKIVEYMTQIYEQGASSSHGGYILAAWQAIFPQYGRYGNLSLPRAHRALQGWRKQRPSLSRPPHAWPVVAGMAVRAAQRHSTLMAKWILVSFSSYTRPGESLTLRGQDFVAPVAGIRYWSLLIKAQDLLVAGKTGEFDDSVVWDSPALKFLEKDFARWQRLGAAIPWTFGYNEVLATVKQCALDLQVVGFTPYSLRHSGASHDTIHKIRSLQEVQKRGRWRAHRSVTRYEKGGRVGAEYVKIPRESRQWLELCAANLEHYLAAPRRAPLPPGLGRLD